VQCLRQQRGVDCSCSHNSTAMPEVTFINMPAAQGSCSSIYHPMTPSITGAAGTPVLWFHMIHSPEA
jgi:hypothetical protein